MKPHVLLFLAFAMLFSELSAQVLLYDQSTNQTTGGILCRKHTNLIADTASTEGADDFTVPSGVTWYIDSIIAFGFYGSTVLIPPTLSPAIVTIYSNNSGIPGTVVFADTLADADIGNDGNFECYFQNPIILTSGTYFLSVRMFSSNFPWYWTRITEQVSNYPFVWQNPIGGYQVCTSWQALNPCLGIADSSVAFQLSGCFGPKPVLSLGSDTTLCNGDSITVSTGVANATFDHIWSTGDSSLSVSLSNSGNYFVTVTDQTTLCSSTENIVISNSNPISSNPLLDAAICAGNNVTFSVSTCNACSTLWSNGETSNSISIGSSGTYSVLVTDTTYGCSESDTASLIVNDPGLVIVPGNLVNLCEGREVLVTTSIPYNSYVWQSGNNQAIFTDTAVIDQDGLYGVTISDSIGCSAIDSFTVVLRPTPVPVIQKQVISNYEVKLSTTEPFETYYWSNEDEDDNTIVNSNGAYTVTVTNEFGCEGEAIIGVGGVWVLGIDESTIATFNIYPNPASSFLQIEWPSKWVGEAESILYDISGRIVKTFNATESNQIIGLEALAPGSYTLSTSSPDGVAVKTIVIQ